MEKTVRFETYKKMRDHALAVCDGPLPDVDPHLINPIELAYIGDAVFSLYVRKRLLPVSGHVQVLHDLAARMVSAVMQPKPWTVLNPSLQKQKLWSCVVDVIRSRQSPKARLSASTGKGRLLKPSWDGSTLQGKRRA